MGLNFKRVLTTGDKYNFGKTIECNRVARVVNDKGELLFEQDNVEAPSFWSDQAVNIAVSKYFREGEYSIIMMMDDISSLIANFGYQIGYFDNDEQRDIFCQELMYLMIYQMGAFNSPVYFNLRHEENVNVSACYINSVEDSIESIMYLAKKEAVLFKGGSGTGTNYSKLRSSKENVRAGGKASGPISFMKGYDSFAGIIRSGGKLRRAARICILNVDHPDIREFIFCKVKEEEKARVLIDAGYDGSVGGEAYGTIAYQNGNNTVRVTDMFMEAVEDDEEYSTFAVTTGAQIDRYKAKDILREIAESVYNCGDPALQYDDNINKWNTCKSYGRINASNPCAEFHFLDNSACNLASLNLLKFLKDDNNFDIELFKHAVDIFITAQDILVDMATYPTPEIRENSIKFRPLGLGYSNLGALLMVKKYPYDSDVGRNYASDITSLMTAEAYKQSQRIAEVKGHFDGYRINRDSVKDVIELHHYESFNHSKRMRIISDILEEANNIWDEVIEYKGGVRNAQVSLLAPCGTIGFMMGCDTLGVEPDYSLVKYKSLVGGGSMKIINGSICRALYNLGYGESTCDKIYDYIIKNGTIEGCDLVDEEDLPIFDCSSSPEKGSRFISPMGHIKMMAAVQPFLSGAISKTVNLQNDVTVDEIEDIYIESWKLGLKAIALYRDGCKCVQPLNNKEKKEMVAEHKVTRRKLLDVRDSITHKFSIGGQDGYVIVGLYDDGSPGEMFIKMAKEGSIVSGMMDSFAIAISIALQYGVPLDIFAEKYIHTRFEPSGFTGNKDIPIAKSIVDYIFRWLQLRFEKNESNPVCIDTSNKTVTDNSVCMECGSISVRAGSCYICSNCGTSSGCS